MIRVILVYMFSILLFSCGENSSMKYMSHIKVVANTNPMLATRMMDTLAVGIKGESEYLRMKYELLKLELNDKNNVLPTSNKMIEYLVKYFDKNGTESDRYEAYFYAGSVYRDLHDTPRSMAYFEKIVNRSSDRLCTDSLLLRNAYSNLYYLFFNVQDYANAKTMAENEYKVSVSLRDVPVNTIMHLGSAYMAVGEKDKAIRCFDTALSQIISDGVCREADNLYVLLYNYANLGCTAQAVNCFRVISDLPRRSDALAYNSLGKFYRSVNRPDSAIICYEHILESSKDEYNKYDAAKALFQLYKDKGCLNEAVKYGNDFVNLTENLDLYQNQQLAATVNNKFQYHLDQEKMQKNELERELFMRITIIVASCALLLICFVVLLYMYKKNKALNRELTLTDKLSDVKVQLSKLKKSTAVKEQMLEEAHNDIEAKEKKLQVVNDELARNEQLLEEVKERLEKKMQQSQSLMQMLQRVKLEEKANDVVEAVRKTAEGKKCLSSTEWNRLFAAVNELFPNFKDELLRNNSDLNEQQLQVCYLMKIGMNGPQINNIVDISRTTVWRWVKAYSWIYGIDNAES